MKKALFTIVLLAGVISSYGQNPLTVGKAQLNAGLGFSDTITLGRSAYSRSSGLLRRVRVISARTTSDRHVMNGGTRRTRGAELLVMLQMTLCVSRVRECAGAVRMVNRA